MVTALSGTSSVVQAPTANSGPQPVASPCKAAAEAADTATISPAGQKALQGSQDVDHDADGH